MKMSVDEHKSVITNRPRDCLACKLVGGFGLTGAGLYVMKQAYSMKKGLGQYFIYTFGLGSIGLGIARLMDLPPFDTFQPPVNNKNDGVS